MITIRKVHRESPSRVGSHQLAATLYLVLVTVLAANSHAQSRGQTGRRFGLNDLFSLQQLGYPYSGSPIAFSPDGKQLAFVIQRPRNKAKFYPANSLAREDLFVLPSPGGQAINITNGLADGSGYWAPTWSPDGGRLAMLSTKNNNICAWVWDQASGSLHQLTDRAVDILWFGSDHPFYWISPTKLLVPLLPQGVKADEWVRSIPMDERAYSESQKTWKGEGVAVSVLASGVNPDLGKRRQSDLMLIDVVTGQNLLMSRGNFQNIVTSPDRKTIAFLKKVGVHQPDANSPLEFNIILAHGTFELEVIGIDGTSILPSDPAIFGVIPTSLRWSPDSQELAFLTYTKNKAAVPQLCLFSKSKRILKMARTSGIDPYPAVRQLPQIEWTSKGWIVFASRPIPKDSARVGVRRDWWLIREDAAPRCLTLGMKTPPILLLHENQSDSLIGAAEGQLWRISPDSEPLSLTKNFGKAISNVLGMTIASGEHPQALILGQDGDKQEPFVIDLVSRQLTAIPLPAPNAVVLARSPVGRATLFSSNDGSGFRLWLAGGSNSQTSKIFEANTFLQEVQAGKDERIRYKSLDGEDLSGWLLLPPDYDRSKRYPLLVWVYPGWRAGTSPSILSDISFVESLNLQIPAARGYVVLRPSMPLNPEGVADDPMLKLPSGVIPAIDKVIELGIADPDRVFLMGHSFGGYATFGLVTQTKCFRAAVAMSWASDLVSYYNNLPPEMWRTDYPHENPSTSAATIESALRLGGLPPWKDLGRYLRNSPIFYVDRVETPLMIICGDMDGPFEGAQEFFMALHRQGKRAEFVRYWGEGHVLQSPPNIHDMWDRIFAWFDEFSPTPSRTETSKH